MHAAAALVENRGQPFARQRDAVVAAHPELQERELLKRARMTRAIQVALVRRDLPEFTARLAAEIATGIFSASYQRWSRSTAKHPPKLVRIVDEALARTAEITADARLDRTRPS